MRNQLSFLFFLFIVITSLSYRATAQSFAVGGYHSLAICTDASVRAWGWNVFGEIGDNTTVDALTPVQVVGLSNISAVAAGYQTSYALNSNGTVWAWGLNTDAQIGDNTTVTKRSPVQVTGLSGIIKIGGGDVHSMALKSDGTVWCWGDNAFGEIGDNTTTDRRTPIQTLNLSGIVSVVAGTGHSHALKSDGTVWSWGWNLGGALGDNSTVNKKTPVQAIGLTGVQSIGGGGNTAFALKSDGTVWAWGSNNYGQVGDNTTVNRWTPIQTIGLSGITAIGIGSEFQAHAIALRSDGTAWTWGSNYAGQLGDNSIFDRYTPVQVTGLSGVVAVAAGGNAHSLALKSNGSLWAWGRNYAGAIGDNTSDERHTPVQPMGLCSVPHLPVELLYFTAVAENNEKVRCDWATASEINNDHFNLERSQDGINFSQIMQVPSAVPGGNCSTPLYYTRYDYDPYTGLSYYRLKQIDINGQFAYSPIRAVYIGVTDIISIYPNPSVDGYIHYIVASQEESSVTIQVIDVLGRSVVSRQEFLDKGVTQKQLSTTQLSSGSYLIRIISSNQEKVQKQFMVK